MNHTRARSLASPSRAEAVGVGVGEARRGAARPDGRAVRCACAAGRDVQVRRDVLRREEHFAVKSIKTENKR